MENELMGMRKNNKIILYANMNGTFLGDYRRTYIGCIKYDEKYDQYYFEPDFFLKYIKKNLLKDIYDLIDKIETEEQIER